MSDGAGGGEATRIDVVLQKPPVGWWPKPTIVIDGRGQPAQWGRGTWQVRPGTTFGVYLYNRMWRFGAAETVLAEPLPRILSYRPPLLPFGPGRLDPA